MIEFEFVVVSAVGTLVGEVFAGLFFDVVRESAVSAWVSPVAHLRSRGY